MRRERRRRKVSSHEEMCALCIILCVCVCVLPYISKSQYQYLVAHRTIFNYMENSPTPVFLGLMSHYQKKLNREDGSSFQTESFSWEVLGLYKIVPVLFMDLR